MTEAGIGMIILLGWIIIIVVSSIFIAASIVFIINLIKAIKKKWPKKYLIPVIISGAIISVTLFLVVKELLETLTYQFTHSNSSSIETTLFYLKTLSLYF